MELLVRNKVRNFDNWKRVAEADSERGRAAGLTLRDIWRSVDDPDEVFFIFDVEDRERAETFMHTPESAAAGVEAGVINGEAWFVVRSG